MTDPAIRTPEEAISAVKEAILAVSLPSLATQTCEMFAAEAMRTRIRNAVFSLSTRIAPPALGDVEGRWKYAPEPDTVAERDRFLRSLDEEEAALRTQAAQLAGWQDIATAPKDGTRFDGWAEAFGGYRLADLYFENGVLRQDVGRTSRVCPLWPTYWRPLPLVPRAPAALSGGEDGR